MKQPQNPNPRLRKVAIVAGLVATLVGMYVSQRAKHPPPRESGPASGQTRAHVEPAPSGGAARRADFDFYLLAMSMHRAFCDDGHERKPECRAASPRPLVIHGLWPERRGPREYPHDCPAPPLDLEPALARELADYMPGMSSGLHQHEWREHGGCSGLGDDEYFHAALEHAKHLDAALRATLTTHAGGVVTADDLRAAADGFERGLGATITFHCRTPRGASQRDRPYLMEVRQCLDDDGTDGGPGTALACATVNRRDQGCGDSFRIAGE